MVNYKMEAYDFKEDEKRVRAAIREFENAKFNVENGAPVFRPQFQAVVDEVEKYI